MSMRVKLLGTLIAGLMLSLWVYYWPVSISQTDNRLIIQPSSTVSMIARTLKHQGVIRSTGLFRLLSRVLNYDQRLQAGQYKLPKQLSYHHLFQILTGQVFSARSIRLTLVPGMALPEIAAMLHAHDGRDPDDFIHYVTHDAKADLLPDYPVLATNPTSSLEGYFYPDTYTVAYDTSNAALVRLWVDRLHQQLMPIVPNRVAKQAGFTFHEYLTLAAIIEKEGAVVSEFPNIAAVFYNRLARNQKLQSCPTVAYALGDYRRAVISYADLQVVSDYNTYHVAGLPPTPIAIVSHVAFEATLNPTPEFEYYYFVADKNKTHRFSKTYDQHIKNQALIMTDNI